MVTFVLQFVHRAIGGVCDKEGLHYEDFAKLLSLSEYSKLRHSLTAAIRQLARAGVKRQEVGGGRGKSLTSSYFIYTTLATLITVQQG